MIARPFPTSLDGLILNIFVISGSEIQISPGPGVNLKNVHFWNSCKDEAFRQNHYKLFITGKLRNYKYFKNRMFQLEHTANST